MSNLSHQMVLTEAAMSDEKRQMQDLSLNDAEALQAFVAKRKWFEVKLIELEAHEPIYPFVQVDLNPKQRIEASAVQPNAGLKYGLPQLERVIKWQEERDAVEEEVIAFDGGDLERMKRKTRAVTLIPLTPPSTELVEVTLDLIVVVDRLLTLLRRRSELLELTRLRLHWDELRLSASRELDGMKVESDSIVARKCEWLPIGSRSGPNHTNHPNDDLAQSCPSPPPTRQRAVDTAPSTPRQSILSLPDTPSPTRHSPSSISHATPRRASLRIPLLRSQITNLRIRHTTFSATLLPRVGALLDKMIDIAGPLKDLGGVNGPLDQGTEGDGAVPGKLLDAQDDLEAQATKIGEHVLWCQQLEAQCTSAEHIHSSLINSCQAASDLVVRLANVVDLGPDNLRRLRAGWEAVSTSLPPDIDRNQFTSSPIPHHQQNTEHEAQVVQILEDARKAAQTALEKGKEVLDWLNKLSEQLSIVEKCGNDLASRESQVVGLLAQISSYDVSTDSSSDSANQDLAADLEDWHTRTLEAGEERPDLSQRSTIAAMRYRAILKNPPSSFADATLSQHETALTRLDELHESTASKTAELLMARTRFTCNQQVDRLVGELQDASSSIRSGLATIQSELANRIEAASWKGHRRNELISGEDIDVQLSKLCASIDVDLIERLHNLEILAGDDPRYAATLSTSRDNVNSARMIYQTAYHHRELLDKVMAQTHTVYTIHDEADTFLARTKSVNFESLALAGLRKEITTWLDGIADRVPFLSVTPSEIPHTDRSTGSPAPALSETSRSAPASPTSYSDIAARLASTDFTVREGLNSLTAGLSSALDLALGRTTEKVEPRDDGPVIEDGQQTLEARNEAASQFSDRSTTPTTQLDSDSTVSDQETCRINGTSSPVKEIHGPHPQQFNSELSPVDLHPRSTPRAKPRRNHHVQEPKVVDPLGSKVGPRPRYISHTKVPRQSSMTSRAPAKQVASSSSTPTATPAPDPINSASMPRPRYSSRSGLPPRASLQSSSLSPQTVTPTSSHDFRSASLGRAAGNLYSTRRAPSISHGLSQYPSSSHLDPLGSSSAQRENRILARSTSMRSISLGRSTSSTPSARRNISASTTSNSSQSRISSSRSTIISSQRSARKYVPDPANKLDVAVGDIVNGFKVHVPIVPIGMTARDEYKDMTGSYWIGAEGRAKLCYCRILRSQMVMVRVGGGWVELSKFLLDHFGGSAIEQSLSSLSLNEQMEETPTHLKTPVRPRIASSTSTVARTPNHTDASPQKGEETSGSPLTPLRFIKRASVSPDVRQKEKASLRIGRRSILGKEQDISF